MRQPRSTIPTGLPGLDVVLGGGLRPNRMYLFLGDPGVGKTTLGLQFLLEGVRRGERCLYATLSETKDELEDIADAHGWSLEGVDIVALHAVEHSLGTPDVQTIFHPVEIDLDQFTEPLRRMIEQVKPVRAVIDSLSEMRIIAQDPRRFRRQMMALKQHFTDIGCTLALLDDRTAEIRETIPQTVAHGVIVLESVVREYGSPRRRIRVSKLRGARLHEGYHDFQIVTGGLVVYPRLVAAEHAAGFTHEAVSSGVTRLDQMLGGGLLRGTSTLVTGAAGAGKSVVVTQYAFSAAERGEPAAIFVFDESRESFLMRAAGAGMDLGPHLATGRVRVQQVDPAEMPPGQFAHAVRRAVLEGGARIVAIDSLNGYLTSVPEEAFLELHLHELLATLAQLGVVTLTTLTQSGATGPVRSPDVDVSYLADTIISLRFFEAMGEMRKAISVPKMRSGLHELTLREYRIGPQGLTVGEPLHQFQGVLTGTPTYVGSHEPLLGAEGAADAR